MDVNVLPSINKGSLLYYNNIVIIIIIIVVVVVVKSRSTRIIVELNLDAVSSLILVKQLFMTDKYKNIYTVIRHKFPDWLVLFQNCCIHSFSLTLSI